jgi:AbrB family looped-hinge helix DNA binding protein
MKSEGTSPQVATVSSKGQLVIPANIREALGIGPGTKLVLTIEKSHILLRPVTAKLVEELRGILAGGPSMADELQAQRRADDKKW